ncbi:MAG: membrane-bound metal-dependent hydrolase YbcI (DUF457 family) [Cyclobacteriaceae bacterium]|jgi:membrane-bound metal-dependent hydrolase YbcI (DUF457 family)
MFIGHYAVGFASKKISKTLPLPMIFVAVQFLDLLWPILVLLGIEKVSIVEGITKMTPLDFTFYPYSHSLLMTIVWALLFGLVYYGFTKDRQHSIILGVLVFSHWVLDLIVHRPDMPLSPFSTYKIGLGLWNYPVIEIIVEFGLMIYGVITYWRIVKPTKKLSFWLMVGFFLVFQVLNFVGPLPPNADAVAWGANMLWLFVAWAWWTERERSPRTT